MFVANTFPRPQNGMYNWTALNEGWTTKALKRLAGREPRHQARRAAYLKVNPNLEHDFEGLTVWSIQTSDGPIE